MRVAVVLLLLCVEIVSSAVLRQQAVAVRGKLMCGDGIPAGRVLVKLWDDDFGKKQCPMQDCPPL